MNIIIRSIVYFMKATSVISSGKNKLSLLIHELCMEDIRQ